MLTRLVKEMMILGLGFVSVVYLIFPTLGIFELIPDAIPLIGSLDEVAATGLLLNVMNYYGINMTNLFSKPAPKKLKRPAVRRQLPDQTPPAD